VCGTDEYLSGGRYLSSRFAELDIPRGEQAAFEAELAMVWPAMRKVSSAGPYVFAEHPPPAVCMAQACSYRSDGCCA
jgi:hypothetical protein